MTVRAVGFDLDHTLAVTGRRRPEILQNAAERVGGPSLADRVSREAYLRAHGDHHVAETRAPVFEALLDRRAPEAEVDPEEFSAAYREELAEALRAVEGVEQLLADLRGQYPLGLLTNGPGVAQRDKLRELGWTDRFDPIVVSGELGHAKPDRRAFEALCQGLDADPAETAYVGDQQTADVEGATDAGLWVVQVLGESEDDPDPHPQADATVRRSDLAADLPGILADLNG